MFIIKQFSSSILYWHRGCHWQLANIHKENINTEGGRKFDFPGEKTDSMTRIFENRQTFDFVTAGKNPMETYACKVRFSETVLYTIWRFKLFSARYRPLFVDETFNIDRSKILLFWVDYLDKAPYMLSILEYTHFIKG